MARVSFLLILMIFTMYGCKKQCAILQEKIYQCKDDIGSCKESDDQSNLQNQICTHLTQELNIATTLVDDMVRAIEQGSEFEDDLEDICSMALSSKEDIEIDFSKCKKSITYPENYDDLAEVEEIDLMKQFGRKGLLDGKQEQFTLRLNLLSEGEIKPDQYCIGDIYNRYIGSLDDRGLLRLKLNKLSFESLKKKVLIRRDNNLFIDHEAKYIGCDFNTRDAEDQLPPRLIEYLNQYDLVICSKSDGWYQAEDDCALSRQEIFLFRFKKNPLTYRCEQSCRNGTDDFLEACNIDCVDKCGESCQKLYSVDQNLLNRCRSVCKLDQCCTTSECQEQVVIWAEDQNKDSYLSYDGTVCPDWCDNHCEDIHTQKKDGAEDTRDECQSVCKYKNCLTDPFFQNFQDNALYHTIVDGCSEADQCDGDQFCPENSWDGTRKIEILDESTLLIFFREATEEKSGTSCDTDAIFPPINKDVKDPDKPFCYIEFKLSEEEE